MSKVERDKEIEVKVDQAQMAEIMEILENLEDEALAVHYLKLITDKSRSLGAMVLNRDPELSHGQWMTQCQKLKAEMDDLIAQIHNLK